MDFLLIVRTFLCLLLTLHSSTPLYWPLACFPFPCLNLESARRFHHGRVFDSFPPCRKRLESLSQISPPPYFFLVLDFSEKEAEWMVT